MADVNRLLSADDEAYQSMLAWQLGPKVFIRYILDKAEGIRKRVEAEAEEIRKRKRVEAEYAATNDTGEPQTETGGTGGGERGSRSRAPPSGNGGIPTESQ